MKSVIAILAVLAISCSAKQLPSVCESCQSMVQNFIDASSDQFKMTQMKASLSVMCEGTSHQEDCQQTLNKLDFIAYKLAPYLKNTEAVCAKLQMCGQSSTTFAPISRLAMLFYKKSQSDVANDNMMKQQICEECKVSATQLKDIFSMEETLTMTKEFVETFICKSSGKYQSTCSTLTSAILPQLIQEMAAIFNQKESVCANMELCQGPKEDISKLISAPVGELSDVWKSIGLVQTANGEELMSCFDCTLAVDGLIEEFINKRQMTADDIQGVVCSKVTDAWKVGCNDFVHMYMSTVLFLTYNQFDGKAVCVDMHSCPKKNVAAESFLPKEDMKKLSCMNCGAYESFFANNAQQFHPHAVKALVSNVCLNLPHSFQTMCAHSANRLSTVFFNQLSTVTKGVSMCSQVC